MKNMQLRKLQKQKARQEKLRVQKAKIVNMGRIKWVILHLENGEWHRHGTIRTSDDLELAKKNASKRLVAESEKTGPGVLHGARIVDVDTQKDVWMEQRRGPPAKDGQETITVTPEQISVPGTKEPVTTT